MKAVVNAQSTVLAEWAATVEPKAPLISHAQRATNAYHIAVRGVRACLSDISAKQNRLRELTELNAELQAEVFFALDVC